MIEIRSLAQLEKITRLNPRFMEEGTEVAALYTVLTEHPWLLPMLGNQLTIAKAMSFNGKRQEFSITERQCGAQLKLRISEQTDLNVSESECIRHFEEFKKCLMAKVLMGFLNLVRFHYPAEGQSVSFFDPKTFEPREWNGAYPTSGEGCVLLSDQHALVMSL